MLLNTSQINEWIQCCCLLQAFDGFLLVVSQKGIILYVSELITTLLGHSQVRSTHHKSLNIVIFSGPHSLDAFSLTQLRERLQQIWWFGEIDQIVTRTSTSLMNSFSELCLSQTVTVILSQLQPWIWVIILQCASFHYLHDSLLF